MTEVDVRLSVVLTVKGREEYTKRWLRHHPRMPLPWRMIVADGDPGSGIKALVDRESALAHAGIAYWGFDDVDLKSYLRKVATVVASLETPYVMLVDNDDFILPGGVTRAVNFLDDHSEYSACGGANLGVNCVPEGFSEGWKPAVHGDWSDLRIIYPPVHLDMPSAHDRVNAQLRRYVPLWYCVQRTDCLRACMGAILDLQISDILVVELFQALCLVAYGKVRQDHDCAVYLRQTNSSMLSASLPGVWERIFRGTLVPDVRRAAQFIGSVAAECDDLEQGVAVDAVLAAWIERERKLAAPSRPAGVALALRHSIGRWLSTARAKSRILHKVFQRYELRRVLRKIARVSACPESDVRVVEGDIRNALSALAPGSGV